LPISPTADRQRLPLASGNLANPRRSGSARPLLKAALMKKFNRKPLQLDTQTLRSLTTEELRETRGGAVSSQHQGSCSEGRGLPTNDC
jgi:hypothetical protein